MAPAPALAAESGLSDYEDITVDGPRTRRWVLDAETCGELKAHRIARLGIDTTAEPYARVRHRPSGSFLLACMEGAGLVLLEGRWHRITQGSLCLAPPRVLNSFRAEGREPWVFGWLRYEEPPHLRALVGAESPLHLPSGGEEIGRVITGLRSEWESARDPALVHHWIMLIHGLARRAAQPWQHARSRLASLWEVVAADLSSEWTLAKMAARCHLSTEHLRRTCLLELGRTPVAHVTYMRMQYARHLLEMNDDKLEVIAAQSGYGSASVFSKAFVRCVGLTPSEYRARSIRGAGADQTK